MTRRIKRYNESIDNKYWWLDSLIDVKDSLSEYSDDGLLIEYKVGFISEYFYHYMTILPSDNISKISNEDLLRVDDALKSKNTFKESGKLFTIVLKLKIPCRPDKLYRQLSIDDLSILEDIKRFKNEFEISLIMNSESPNNKYETILIELKERKESN